MTTTETNHSMPNTKKKRLLTASKKKLNEIKSVTEQTNGVKKRRIRRLHQPKPNLNPNVENQITQKISSQPVPPVTAAQSTSKATETPTPRAPKRSLRQASQRIAEKEEKRKVASKPVISAPVQEEKPAVRKKRKLNSQKIILPTTRLTTSEMMVEETCNISYSEYLESASSTTVTLSKNRPSITIGLPNKAKRTLGASTLATPPESAPSPQSEPAPSPRPVRPRASNFIGTLDLSKHSFFPNESYIAHLPKRTKPAAAAATNLAAEDNSQVVYTMSEETSIDEPVGTQSDQEETQAEATHSDQEETQAEATHSDQEETQAEGTQSDQEEAQAEAAGSDQEEPNTEESEEARLEETNTDEIRLHEEIVVDADEVALNKEHMSTETCLMEEEPHLDVEETQADQEKAGTDNSPPEEFHDALSDFSQSPEAQEEERKEEKLKSVWASLFKSFSK